jgi:hypothetical protein
MADAPVLHGPAADVGMKVNDRGRTVYAYGDTPEFKEAQESNPAQDFRSGDGRSDPRDVREYDAKVKEAQDKALEAALESAPEVKQAALDADDAQEGGDGDEGDTPKELDPDQPESAETFIADAVEQPEPKRTNKGGKKN